MKNKFLEAIGDVSLSKKFNMAFCTVMGAVIGGLIYKLGENTGTYHGTIETNERWHDAIDQIVEEENLKSQIDGKQE